MANTVDVAVCASTCKWIAKQVLFNAPSVTDNPILCTVYQVLGQNAVRLGDP